MYKYVVTPLDGVGSRNSYCTPHVIDLAAVLQALSTTFRDSWTHRYKRFRLTDIRLYWLSSWFT